ncbi:MAG: patatin family protein [Monoglobaceae bacterium]
MKTGLVLEGGAMRGMFTAGVVDVLCESGISFDGVIGVSAGAVFGVNYLSGQTGRVIRYNKRFNSDKNYMSMKLLLKTGNIFNTDFAYGTVPRELDKFDDEAFIRSAIPFYAVITNIKSGNPEYVKINSGFEQMDVLRASASMPFVSKPVEINGNLYLDGGISDSIPFEKFAEMGYDRQVVVLTRDINYKKKSVPKLPVKLYFHRYPEFAKRIIARAENYNNKVWRLRIKEKQGDVLVIRPSIPINIRKTEKNPDKLQEVYDLGRADAEKSLDKIKRYLETGSICD